MCQITSQVVVEEVVPESWVERGPKECAGTWWLDRLLSARFEFWLFWFKARWQRISPTCRLKVSFKSEGRSNKAFLLVWRLS